MEPRSITRAGVCLRPIAEPGLITIGYVSLGSRFGFLELARDVAGFKPAGVGEAALRGQFVAEVRGR
jgi:hypothetical protein